MPLLSLYSGRGVAGEGSLLEDLASSHLSPLTRKRAFRSDSEPRAIEENVMASASFAVELKHIDRMTRDELLAAIRSKQDCLREDLLESLEGQSTDHLQLLLLAARLIQVLRQAPDSCRCDKRSSSLGSV